MPLPRVTKIQRVDVPASEAPDWTECLGVQDPYGTAPSTDWLRIDDQRFPKPARLERRDGERWIVLGEGVFRVHAYLAPDRALVSQDQERLYELGSDGSERTIWAGPKLLMKHGGAIWGGNWMFAATALPGGRWVGAVPATDDSTGGPETWTQELVLFSADHERLASLPLPERTASAVKKGHPRRFVATQVFPVLEGRAVLIPDVDVLAVGIYGDRLEWMGKTTMHSEGRMWSDGKEALISNSVANSKISWWRLVGLDDLWQKHR